MPFYRSYTIQSTRTNDEYLEYIKELLHKSYHKVVIVPNDYPYDLLNGKPVKTHHLTMRYTPDANKLWLRHRERELMNR
jgi:hypothetical protein